MNKRPHIPEKLTRQLFLEVGFRCAIPRCGESSSLDIAHITALTNGGPSSFENLIVLCANCHRKYDSGKQKLMDKKMIVQIKKNLQILNGRYSHYEMRLLHFLLDSKKSEIFLFGREIDLYFLLKDRLLSESPKRLQNSLNFPPKLYLLTEEGKKFIEKWGSGNCF